MGPERSGLMAWHNAPCAWCDVKATGEAIYRVQGMAVDWFASCGKHGDNFKAFTDVVAGLSSAAGRAS